MIMMMMATISAQYTSRFSMPLSLGDQDWFTMLAWQVLFLFSLIFIIFFMLKSNMKVPSLFQPLPCEWNYQKSLQYLTDPKVSGVYHDYDDNDYHNMDDND